MAFFRSPKIDPQIVLDHLDKLTDLDAANYWNKSWRGTSGAIMGGTRNPRGQYANWVMRDLGGSPSDAAMTRHASSADTLKSYLETLTHQERVTALHDTLVPAHRRSTLNPFSAWSLDAQAKEVVHELNYNERYRELASHGIGAKGAAHAEFEFEKGGRAYRNTIGTAKWAANGTLDATGGVLSYGAGKVKGAGNALHHTLVERPKMFGRGMAKVGVVGVLAAVGIGGVMRWRANAAAKAEAEAAQQPEEFTPQQQGFNPNEGVNYSNNESLGAPGGKREVIGPMTAKVVGEDSPMARAIPPQAPMNFEDAGAVKRLSDKNGLPAENYALPG